jgi:alanine racemase
MTTSHRCWAEIDPDALRHNLLTIRSMVAPGVKVMAVVKADAYGHGLPGIARLMDNEVDLFGVACLKEAQEIRASGANSEIVILSPALPDERPAIVTNRFIPTVSTLDEAVAYADRVPNGETIPIHFVVDTGMGRMGLWGAEVPPVLEAIRTIPKLRIEALASHLPVSDEDFEYTKEQLSRFETERHQLAVESGSAAILNGAGILRFGASAKPGDIVRVGLPFYGVSPLPEHQQSFQPALALKTRVTLVRVLGPGRSISYGRTFITPKTMRVATLAVGYGDGFDRHLSGRETEVLVQGTRCRVLGRITMDQIMVDVTHLDSVFAGEEAVLIGRQSSEEVSAVELATKADTIAWAIFTGITRRVERVYL